MHPANETFTVNLSNAQGGATIADGSATATITNDDAPPALAVKIHDIQGTAFYSPILAAEGKSAFNQASSTQVTISGVVTALDLFGGSGSTAIAAEQTGRTAFLMELDPLYCDVIVQRYETFTGRKAERIPAKGAAA